MIMVPYRWPVEIVRAHFALQVLNSKLLESFFKILNWTVVLFFLKIGTTVIRISCRILRRRLELVNRSLFYRVRYTESSNSAV
jgi:hypothetical protein